MSKKSKRNKSQDEMSSSSSQGTPSEETDFDELFECFSKVGDRESDDIALRNIDKWFKQAKVFDKNITTADTAIIFSRVAKNKKKLTKEEFREMLNTLAEDKDTDYAELKTKLLSAGRPSFAGTTRAIRGSVAADAMERLTDSSIYTGTHRERFDSEGKGRGLSGRYEIADADGYVQGYKQKGTYDESKENIEDDDSKK